LECNHACASSLFKSGPALIVGTGAVLAANALVFAQDKSHVGHARHVRGGDGVVPTMPGQDAFGAIQEIVRILEADPNTDWRKINLATLREHLIDMNEVTLEATAVERAIDNGVQIDVTGSGRTLAAIQRMLPAHARELNGLSDWRSETEGLANGIRLTVISDTAAEIAHIRGLGFIGLMVSGSHHQPHHLAMARGEHLH
jgi:hypothetical protein